jgi:ribonucleoside-triphosphate reductase
LCITYCEIPSSSKHNVDALEEIVNYAMDHDIPYFAINVPNDQCKDCGYIDEIGETCPVCGGSNIRRLRRVTGYISAEVGQMNKGKQDEVKNRVKHVNS